MTVRIKAYELQRFLFAFLIGFVPVASQAAVVVIGHVSIAVNSVTPIQAKKLWLGKLKRLPGVGKISVVDQSTESIAHAEFYNKVAKKRPAQLKAYWARESFTGKGFPPKQLRDDAAIVKWVASTPGALGYVDSSAVNSSVKVLLTAK